MTGAAILGVVYGVDVQPSGDPLIELVEKAMEIFSTVISPGSFIGMLTVKQLVFIPPTYKFIVDSLPLRKFHHRIPSILFYPQPFYVYS